MKKMKLDQQYHYGLGDRKKKMLIALIIVLLLAFFASFVFTIEHVDVHGNEAVTSEEICRDLGLEEGMNMFQFLILSRIKKTEVNPLLSTLDVYIHWPGTVEVAVTERNVVGYVAYMGMYLCIDASGHVVDSTHAIKEEIPVVSGISISSFTLGQPLTTNNVSFSQVVMDLCNGLAHYGLSSKVLRIDLTDMDDIRLFTDVLEIRLGDEDDLMMKLQALEMILRATPQAAGILHLEDLNGQVYLEKIM